MNDFLEKLRQAIGYYGKKFWSWFLATSRRYQLWRWLVVIFLASFLCMSIYLTFIAKTSNVKGLKNALEQATEIYDKNDQKAGYLYAQKVLGLRSMIFHLTLLMQYCRQKIVTSIKNMVFLSRGSHVRG